MTFKVVSMDPNNQSKVLGTVWASEENQATALASALWAQSDRQVTIRKADEDCEIPLRLPN
jgi:hypothetical protein